MKTFLLLCVFIFSSYILSAQWLWGRTNDPGFAGITEASNLALDANGNSYVGGFYFFSAPYTVGTYSINNPLGEAYIVKYDADGAVLWMDSLGDYSTNINSIIAEPGGDFYVLGQYYGASLTLSGLTITNDSMELESFIVKYNAAGTPLWAKNIASLRGSGYNFCSLTFDKQGNIYAAGAYRGTTANISGHILTNTSISGDSSDVFVVKYNPDGAVVWAKGFGSPEDDYAVSVSVSPLGSLYVLGYFAAQVAYINNDTLIGAPYQRTPFITKLDTNGTIDWAKNVHNHVFPNDLKTDNAGNFITAGYIDSTVFLGSDTLVNVGNHSAFLIMNDADGNVVWGRAANATSGYYCSTTSIALDSCNIWVSGSTTGNINFDGTIVDSPSVNSDNAFIAHYNHCGKFLDGNQLPSGGDDAIQIVADNKANLYFAADYAGVTMHFQQNDLLQPLFNTEFLLLAKYSYGQIVCDTTSCHPSVDTVINPVAVAVTNADQINIYPNPASGSFAVSSLHALAGATLKVLDATGRIMKNVKLTGTNVIVDITGWKPGIYQCVIITHDGSKFNKKLSVF